jgi:hypothetical protein
VDAIDVIELCAREYQDVAYQRIFKSPATGSPNWLDWLNDAQRAIVLVRPDANAAVESIPLVAGTKQAIPATALRLLGVTRNMGADGLTAGPTIRLIDRGTLDDLNRNWHTATAGSSVDEVVYDEKKAPRSFYVTPPLSVARYIEVELSKVPTDVTDPDAGTIALADIYAGPMQAWMLHRAYGMQTQALNMFQRSQFYFTSFFNQLGVKIRGEMFFGAATPGQFPSTGAANAGG